MNILAIVHTEYHLILLTNRILCNPSDSFEVYLNKKAHGKRLNLEFDFSRLHNATFSNLNTAVNLKSELTNEHQNFIKKIQKTSYDEFIFFQQQDAFTLAILQVLKKNQNACKISLYQDGLKPYNYLKGVSFGMLKNDYQVSQWLKLNSFNGHTLKDFINSKRYAYNKEIDDVYLTFPEAYNNWNEKRVKKIEFIDHTKLRQALENIFNWRDELLKFKNNVILYLTQPTHFYGEEECELLAHLIQKLNKPAIVKLHPLSPIEQEKKFKALGDSVQIIRSSIPAELFIMNITNSTCVSLNSTSLFYNTPGNRYYYTAKLFEGKIPRLKRYRMACPISSHINMVTNVDQIE